MKPKKKWFENAWYKVIANKEKKEADVFLYGVIGGWDISASSFVTELNALDDSIETLHVKINSPGGDVFDGIAIYNSLKNSGKKVITYNDSLAASIASVIFMAGEKKVMYDTSELMVHKPWMLAIGNSDQLRRDADLLDKIQVNIRKAYKAGVKDLSDADLDQMMTDETWMDADEAIGYGFADEKGKGEEAPEEDEAKDVFSNQIFAQFTNIPHRIAALIPAASHRAPKPKKEDVAMTPEELRQIVDAIAAVVKPAPDKAPETPQLKAEDIAKAERVRIADIQALGTTMNMPKEVVAEAVEKNLSADQASKIFIEAHAKTLTPVPASKGENVEVGTDEREKFCAAAKISIADAAGLPAVSDEEKKERVAVRKNGMPRSLHGLIRTEARKAGVKNVDGMTAGDLAHVAISNLAQGTGDFTNILADVINKAMGIGLSEAPTTYQMWAGRKSVKDFRTYNHIKLSGFSDLDVLPEGKAFEFGAFSDANETGSITTKGKAYSLPRQVLINDDMDFVAKIPRSITNAVGRKINRDGYDALTSNTFVGPTMGEDSIALFDASTHANYVASGAAPSATTIGVGSLAMSKQPLKAPDQASGTQYTNIPPKFIIAPRALKGTIDEIVRTPFKATSQYPAGIYNPYGPGGDEQLSPVYDAYLDSLDAYGWYLAGDPNAVDTLIYMTLEGNDSPTLRSEPSRVTEALGIVWDIYFDWGFMIGDWRGLYYNAGN